MIRLPRSLAGVAGLVLAAVMASPPCAAPVQDSNSPDDEEIQRLLELHLQEHEAVRLVLLPASATLRGGRAATGLTADDFRLYEDSVPQEIKYFAARTAAPISVAFLLDLSGSMRAIDKLQRAKQAIEEIVASLREDDRIGLIGFADDRVEWITEFTSDRQVFLDRLEVQRGFGPTALYDAVAAAPGLVEGSTTGRKAIVMITDGIDNASTMSLFQALQLARSVEVPIYTLGFSNMPLGIRASGKKGTMLRILEMLSSETGGVLFTVHTRKELRRASRQIQDELRTGYVIGYFPARSDWDGTFRRVRLECTRSAVTVRTRTGYYALP